MHMALLPCRGKAERETSLCDQMFAEHHEPKEYKTSVSRGISTLSPVSGANIQVGLSTHPFIPGVLLDRVVRQGKRVGARHCPRGTSVIELEKISIVLQSLNTYFNKA